jgi:hypothetical protein
MDLHPALTALLGTWRGTGHGEYPTIEPFDYGEEVMFTAPSKPFLVYTQRTWSLATEQPLHAETGYWRIPPAGGVEVMLSHPFGATELLAGSVDDAGGIRLRSVGVAVAPTAKRIDATERDLDVDGDVLRYRVRMASVGLALTHHLAAELHRVG